MKTIITTLLFLLSFSIFSQKQSIIYSNLINKHQDTVWCDLFVWKHHPDNNYSHRVFRFYNQSMIALDTGTYTMQYVINNSSVFNEEITLNEESVIILNIPETRVPLSTFDFAEVVALKPEEFELAIDRRKIIFVEF